MFVNYYFILLMASFVQFNVSTKVGNSTTRLLSRRKRYVAFPEGSSFSVAGCMTVGLIGQPAPTTSPGTFTFGLNWAIAYELPNVTEIAAFSHKKYKQNKDVHQRRSRRDLYEKLESILDKMHKRGLFFTVPHLTVTLKMFYPYLGHDSMQYSSVYLCLLVVKLMRSMGYNGKQCILKTLCETTQRIVPHGNNMVEEIFRTLFTMPSTKLISSEPLEHTIYASAHRLGTLLENCDSMFDCPISLVDWAKGYYNAASPIVNSQRSPWALFSNTFE